MSFSVLDDKIWVRNYQIIEGSMAEDEKKRQEKPISLVEIGPRFVLNLIRIFDGAFGGSTLYENPKFITPNNIRRMEKGKSIIKHQKREQSKMERTRKLENAKLKQDPLSSVFK
jgi:ribosome biogenesis protein BRX1